jgi:excisionase family DNA binding protein
MSPVWMTLPEVAARLGVTETEVRNWRARGTGLSAVRFGKALRYRQAEVDRWATEDAREAYAAATRLLHEQHRIAVFDHYGWRCACCGSTEQLTIDHLNGDGRLHRAKIGHGSSHLYRWLTANGFPEGFQTMCRPCNLSKRDGDRC